MTRLYQWYFKNEDFDPGTLLHGVVTGHRKLPDATKIHTSRVRSVEKGEECIIVQTENTEYICYMKDCNYQKNREFLACYDRFSKIPNGLKKWKEWMEICAAKYENTQRTYSVPKGAILLRLGNNRDCYFDSIWFHDGNGKIREGKGYIPSGCFGDSVLCEMEECDLRYFPYQDRNLEIYVWRTKEHPVYIENCGDRELRVEVEEIVYVIPAEQRLLIEPDNAMFPEAELSSRRRLYHM